MRPIPEIYRETHGAPLDDAAMEQHIRALAVSLNIDGEAALKPSSRTAVRAQLRAARTLAVETESLPASLEWLMENGRLVEAFSQSLSNAPAKKLPAVQGTARIRIIMQELVSHGDALVSSERLTRCLIAFDEVRSLTMDELWAVPSALTASLCDACVRTAAQAIDSQRDRLAALKWVESGAPIQNGLSSRSPAFFECALQRMHEQDMPDKHTELTAWLSEHDRQAEQLISLEHERQAYLRLVLSNLLDTLRMLERLDWSECFRRVSRTELTLLTDPAGTYPRMDEESRELVRRRVREAAVRLDMGEVTVARCAVSAASEYEDIRREVCWWLYTDEGSRALMARAGETRRLRMPALTPDPRGTRYMSAVLLSVMALCLLTGFTLGVWAAIVALPVLWNAVSALAGAVIPRLLSPRTLLKLKLRRVPEELRTLVAMPALLSSPERARELVGQLEALGCLEKDENLSFLLLGDLPDHHQAERGGDEDIIRAAEEAITRANRRAGREKYLLLHRARQLQPCEGRYMGRERKRGALNALNQLLLTGENTFCQENASALAGRFAFVVTLDAGTRMLPGTVLKLIGALAHPLNRPHVNPDGSRGGFAILAPHMELPADAVSSRFIRLYGGRGGIDSYPTAVSDLYQDLCGQGIFGGKGIYDVAAFEGAVSGKLPDNAILSHDLIEGLLARAGFLSDIALYDGHPRTFRAFFMRLNRWTRGDWQLLPLLTRRGLHLRALDRYKIIDNLIRSLIAPVQMLLLYGAFYLRCAPLALLGLLPVLLPLMMYPRWTKDDWMRALTRLAMLPQETHAQLSAIGRSLWRMLVSHKHLLQWVTADDADRQRPRLSPLPGQIAAILLLPALLAPVGWLLGDVLLAALWWSGAALAQALEQPAEETEPLSGEDRELLRDLARRTWRFFSENTPDNGLTPDNVQIDPANGAAQRTSPTNIGLYLASCVSARELGLISSDEMADRIRATTETLESLEKWHGQLYNWYHTVSLTPLRPRYVSSVDSGNLAGCLLLCACALRREEASELADRVEALAREMNFTRLYDAKRKLFVIGMDVENDRLSGSHYDLLASESRILSFTAMMLGQVDTRHWSHLGRMLSPTQQGEALTSWSGTMFEYLMPDLLLPVFENTLLRQTQKTVIASQAASLLSADGRTLPWGVSESGYYAFDLYLNYQYRAFGLPALALRGDPAGQVIAPYASMLTLPFAPEEALDNLRKMIELNWMDDQGLFEAADCSPERLPEGASVRLVRSHMAHHQGMILCAVCNALCDRALTRLFCERPEAQALILLLQEKPAARVRLTERRQISEQTARPCPARRSARAARPDAPLPDTHLMTGGGTMAVLAADGSGFVRKDGLLMNRRENDPTLPPQGFFVHLHNRSDAGHLLLTGMRRLPDGVRQRVQFDAGSAQFHTQTAALDARLTAAISPEDGAFLQHVSLSNTSALPMELEVTACFQVALSREEDYAAHPVFQNLFVESALSAPGALRFSRRPRTPSQKSPLLMHVVSGAEDGSVSWETDLMKLIGREGALCEPGSLAETLSGSLGHVLTPCSALRVRLTLPAHGKKDLCFAAGFTSESEQSAFMERHMSPQTAIRARELAATQARELLRYLNLTPVMHHSLQKAAVLMLYPRYLSRTAQTPPDYDLRRSDLWALGISGDLPILLGFASRADRLEPVRELIRAHEFYRSMGLQTDLVLINDYGNDYEQPVRDRLNDLIAGSHLCGSLGSPGAVHLLEGAALIDRQRELLAAVASLTVRDSEGPLPTQIKTALESVRPLSAQALPPAPGETALSIPALSCDNGFGGFTEDGYLIYRTPAPAPWCNILCNREFGCMVSERGGGFLWYRNSRNGRITPFDNDPCREGWGDLILLKNEQGETLAPALHADSVTHQMGASVFTGGAAGLAWQLTQFVDDEWPVKCQRLTLNAHKSGLWRIQAQMDWLMGVARSDSQLTVTGFTGTLWWARGGIGVIAFAAFPNREVCMEDSLLTTSLSLNAGESAEIDLMIGCAGSMEEIQALISRWQSAGSQARLQHTLTFWQGRLSAIELDTPDSLVNCLTSRFLPYQSLCGRVWGRAGFYQAGGAYGFRDQLQDMLCQLLTDPDMVREHLMLCAAHQFESGDVQHWWHPERSGVRTRITDDLLFLPYVTACYIQETGDRDILLREAPFLKDVDIPEGHEDWYGEAALSTEKGTLNEHCLRAIRRARQTGAHGLLLMGCGDWNDGMNRVGRRGTGESVWLTEFMIVVLEAYAPLCDEPTAAEFKELAGQLREAIEQNAWDGRWYRRAYMDDGTPLGSAETEGGCQIDALAQSWAVIAGLSRERVKMAMAEVEKRLFDRKYDIIKLLTPPFDGSCDPGYIRGYPPGIRENGGQYTHAACWVVMALALLGQADQAWEAYRMLLPSTHSDTQEKALRYRVEPYVIAADIYGEPPHAGRGGWTWYTGAAGWMVRVAYVYLMGYRRRGQFASISALLPEGWDSVSMRVRVGASVYTFSARRDCGSPTLDGQPLPPEGVSLTDDGQSHTAIFPPRTPQEA